ncbi:unnamed protein product [Pleuronectes platessa]|uniref:E3 ubiquitin-protein ligase HECW1/2 N-terminal domain-containing protein n=1 Tax=Pleuronectes platessa TaxID=8262 RepID=A0A9N7TXE0_PLEPL|nr:unnamed protein product [Pleuronectes platessa]
MASPTRSSQTRQRCKGAVRHSYGPDSYAVNGLNQEAFMLGLARSTSDTDLVSPDARSTLTISSSHYTIGQSEDLVITWDIKEDVDAGDWIGMYQVDEALSENFLDYKNRGINGSHRGQIVWKIDSSSNIIDSETQVCFRYYHWRHWSTESYNTHCNHQEGPGTPASDMHMTLEILWTSSGEAGCVNANVRMRASRLSLTVPKTSAKCLEELM